MNASFNRIEFQGMIMQYFGSVYSKDQEKLKSLLDENIQVESQVTINEIKGPLEKFGREKLLEEAAKIANVVKDIGDNDQKYRNYNETETSATITAYCNQELTICKEGKNFKMISNATQNWTTDKIKLTALTVTENDTIVPMETEETSDIAAKISSLSIP
jgi:hypothetical protein